MIKLKPQTKSENVSSPFYVLSELAEKHIIASAIKNKPCQLDVFTNIVSEAHIHVIGPNYPTLASWLEVNPSWQPYLSEYRGNTIGLLSNGESAYFYTPFGLSLAELDDKSKVKQELPTQVLEIEDRAMAGNDNNLQIRRKIQSLIKQKDPVDPNVFTQHINETRIPFLEKGEQLESFIRRHDETLCYLFELHSCKIGVISVLGVIDLFTPGGQPIDELISLKDL